MSRPLKRGLDYFPHDTDTDHDDALDYVEAKHGIEAYGLWWKLLERIYGEEGYYMPWGDRQQTVFAARVRLKPEKVADIVSECISEGLFDADRLARFGVLTSRGIQQRFLSATVRRNDNAIRPELLITETQLSPAESTQRKGKEIERTLDAPTRLVQIVQQECGITVGGTVLMKLKKLAADYDGEAERRLRFGLADAAERGKSIDIALHTAQNATRAQLGSGSVLPDD